MITITVIGEPGPQGSKRFLGTSKSGKGLMIESSAKVKPWREAVVWAAREAMQKKGSIAGPVLVFMTFTLRKPKSAPKNRITYPSKKPDLSKLIRSTEDALVTSGIIEDDARIVELLARKRYPNEGLWALDVPGVIIRIEAFDAAGGPQ